MNNLLKIKYFDCDGQIKVILLFYILGFATGTVTHTIEIINGGFLPYDFVPMWNNVFWTSLTFLDFLTVILLFRSVLSGIILSNLIIISDVVINTSGFTFFADYRVILQIIFCVYVVITTPIILMKLKQQNRIMGIKRKK